MIAKMDAGGGLDHDDPVHGGQHVRVYIHFLAPGMLAMTATPPRAGRATVVMRILLRVVALVVLAWLVHLASGWALGLGDRLKAGAEVRLGAVILMLIVYGALIAIPFVPGVEIGLCLLMVYGAQIAPFVYLATLTGLMLAFLFGEMIPPARLNRVFLDFGLTRAAGLIDRIGPMGGRRRLVLLRRKLPQWIAPYAVRHRHLLLAVLVNLPGNAVIGGGGGIALVAGLSRLYSPVGVLITFALAVAPVPILVYGFNLRLPGFGG
jgi:hypothetical protein